jgi:hypothetical protein
MGLGLQQAVEDARQALEAERKQVEGVGAEYGPDTNQ